MCKTAFYSTPNRQGFSVKFSPRSPSWLALVCNEQCGLRGSGKLSILSADGFGALKELRSHPYPHALFDVSFLTSVHLATGAGDGRIQIWGPQGLVQAIPAHDLELASVDCKGATILSASWDGTVKLWDSNRGHLLGTLRGHADLVHEARFSPDLPNVFASVSSDKTLRVWSGSTSVAVIRSHDAEVLSCDWSRHSPSVLATSGSDGLVRCWDIRSPRQPLGQLKGSEHAVKRLRFSPHFAHVVATASFQPAVSLWDWRRGALLQDFQNHSHYVFGLDWNGHEVAQLADCSWDCQMALFQSKGLGNVRNKI